MKIDRKYIACVIRWLRNRIAFAERLAEEARQTANYGKEVHYMGMLEAYRKCLEQLTERN